MDYPEWIVAKHLLDAQLAFTLEYQTEEQPESYINNAITFFLKTWEEWISVRGVTERRERHLLGDSYSYTIIDFREDKLSRLMSLVPMLEKKNKETWVLWAFAPNKGRYDTSLQNLSDLVNKGFVIDWPLYYVVTNETTQNIDFKENSINWPLALGWDHWEEITEYNYQSLLLTPTGGAFMPSDDIENYIVAGEPDEIDEAGLAEKGFTDEQIEKGHLEGLFHFLSGWRAFDVHKLHNPNKIMVNLDGDEISIDDLTASFGKLVNNTGPAMGKSSLILRNLISQDIKPAAQHEGSDIIYSTVTPVFAIILSKKMNPAPAFPILNWKIDNLISLLSHII
jgi:hypothetical protein